MFFLSSCGTTSKADPVPPVLPQIYIREELPYQIIDHKTSALGEEIPRWVSLYTNQEISEIEALPGYEDRYVFIAANSSSNFKALNQWVAGFSLNQDLPQLVALRVLARFTGNEQRSPEYDYGNYFESAVRTAADTIYSDARKDADFWLLKRYTENEDGLTEYREVYEFFILVSIARDRLQSQLSEILHKATENITLTRDQADAADRLREDFYEGF
jgi:hypothetical protein